MIRAEAKDCGYSEKTGHTCRQVVASEMGKKGEIGQGV